MARGMQLKQGLEPYPGYRLTQFLGRGGWGDVWKAERTDGTCWALKFLPSESQVAAVQEIRALQAIRQLKHPHLVHIDQVWSCPGYLVIVMELAEGSLLDLLDIYFSEYMSPIFPEHLCYYLAQAAESIDFLNKRQHWVGEQRVAFRHCDVKPSNLLIQGNAIKVADFSLAVQTTATMWHHRRNCTLNYAAPEVLHGWLSDRSDQFSLGVTYYQLRTGRLPFPELKRMPTEAYVPPAPDWNGITSAERTILSRALAPVPQNRWPTCVELMQRLGQCFPASTSPRGDKRPAPATV